MKIEVEVPKGKEAKWVNNVLTLVDKEEEIKAGDKAELKYDTCFIQNDDIILINAGTEVKIEYVYDSCPFCLVTHDKSITIVHKYNLEHIVKEKVKDKKNEECLIDITTVENFYNRLKYSTTIRYSCTDEVREELFNLRLNDKINLYGKDRYRLCDAYPSYHITRIERIKKLNSQI